MVKKRSKDPAAFIGIFLISLATLAFQILITRLFSVTLYYHFAFASISLAMLGLTAGAMTLHAFPRFFAQQQLYRRIADCCMCFAFFMLCAVVMHLSIPMTIDRSFASVAGLAIQFVLFTIPFFFSGLCVALLLTRTGHMFTRLYGADLTGAAAGCFAVILLLAVCDVISAIMALSVLASIAGYIFARRTDNRKQMHAAAFLLAFYFLAFSCQVIAKEYGYGLGVRWAKNQMLSKPFYEAWNSHSRIAVFLHFVDKPFGWGFGPGASDRHPVKEQYGMNIDAEAFTPMLRFDGDPSTLSFLADDVVNAAYHVRPIHSVAVIGVGGGRDILSALYFGVPYIEGIELNGNMLHILNNVYGDFTGHLDRRSNVHFIHDEARSRLASSGRSYDLIQISLIDTWASTAAGGLALSENALYTAEAFATFLRALSNDGMLSISRWYFEDRYRGEAHRLLTTAAAALKALHHGNTPSGHIIMLESNHVVTMLVSRRPFTVDDISRVRKEMANRVFRPLHIPGDDAADDIAKLASGMAGAAFLRTLPMDVSPATDDRPFFFNMLRFRDAFSIASFRNLYNPSPSATTVNINAVFVLGIVLCITAVLTALCIALPLRATPMPRRIRSGAMPYFLYFAAIGLGFMCIEISQLQRLTIFLGHPTYGLAVVLFVLLCFSGLGSLFAARILPRESHRLLALVAVLFLYLAVTNAYVPQMRAEPTGIRVAMSILCLAPLSFCMGACLPLGMHRAARHKAGLEPWLWGVNGALSVLGAVIATAFSFAWGIQATYVLGVCCYLVCALAFMRIAGLNRR